MKIWVPASKTREWLFLVYKLEGCQKSMGFLTKHYMPRTSEPELSGIGPSSKSRQTLNEESQCARGRLRHLQR
jgi:hypothetical protein